MNVKNHAVWLWRAGVLIASTLIIPLCLSLPIENFVWYVVFSAIAAAWLRVELAFRMSHAPALPFERWGQASFSIYLVHAPLFVLAGRLGLPFLPTAVADMASIAIVLIGSYAFFVAVERPSHAFARRTGAKRPQTPPEEPLAVPVTPRDSIPVTSTPP